MRVWSEKIKLTSQSRRIYCTPVYFMANMGVYSECLNVQGNFIEQRSKLWRRCYWSQYRRHLLNSTCQVCTVLLREYNWIKGWSIQLHTCIFFRLLFFLLSSCNCEFLVVFTYCLDVFYIYWECVGRLWWYCGYRWQRRNSIRNCYWQLLDWLKTQVRLQFAFK